MCVHGGGGGGRSRRRRGGMGSEAVYDGRVREGSRVDPLDAMIVDIAKTHGEKVVTRNVIRLKGIGSSHRKLLTISPHL